MEGDGISLCHYRPKNYFLPYKIDGIHYKVFIAENQDNEIIGTAAIKIQFAKIRNELKKIAYLCDLKVHPKYRDGRIADQLVKSRINYLKEVYPTDFDQIPLYLSVLENNKKMEKRLSKHYGDQPFFKKVSTIKTFSIPLLFKRKVKTNSLLKIRTAKREDWDTMNDLWEDKNKSSDFYTPLNKEDLLDRKGLINIHHYKVITNDQNEMIGFFGVSNFDGIKETKIFKYSIKMNIIKKLLNFLFSLFKKKGLPDEGSPLKMIQTFHLCIEKLTKEDFSEFLTLIYNDSLDNSHIFLNINVPDNFPYQKEFSPFLSQTTRTDLYFSNNSPKDINKGIQYEVAFV
jgi:hypothetical protein